MPGGGYVTISISEIDLTSLSGERSLSPGKYACIEVADTGVGMSGEVLRRIGEPFFTTRSSGEGTGLGVPMIHAFVRQSGGALRVESTPGAGSVFRILLPIASEPASPTDEGWSDQQMTSESA
jgi:signal transduction histidine kinase